MTPTCLLRGSRQRSCLLAKETNPTGTLDAREREHDWNPSNLMHNKVHPCGSKILIWAMKEQKAAEKNLRNHTYNVGVRQVFLTKDTNLAFPTPQSLPSWPLHCDPPEDRSFIGCTNSFWFLLPYGFFLCQCDQSVLEWDVGLGCSVEQNALTAS